MHLPVTFCVMLLRIWRALLDTATVLSICMFVGFAVLWYQSSLGLQLGVVTYGLGSDAVGPYREGPPLDLTFYKSGVQIRTGFFPQTTRTISYPQLMLIASAIPAIRLLAWTGRRLRTRRRRSRGQCLRCGYDLRGSPQGGRCPECGTEAEFATDEHR